MLTMSGPARQVVARYCVSATKSRWPLIGSLAPSSSERGCRRSPLRIARAAAHQPAAGAPRPATGARASSRAAHGARCHAAYRPSSPTRPRAPYGGCSPPTGPRRVSMADLSNATRDVRPRCRSALPRRSTALLAVGPPNRARALVNVSPPATNPDSRAVELRRLKQGADAGAIRRIARLDRNRPSQHIGSISWKTPPTRPDSMPPLSSPGACLGHACGPRRGQLPGRVALRTHVANDSLRRELSPGAVSSYTSSGRRSSNASTRSETPSVAHARHGCVREPLATASPDRVGIARRN